MSTLELRIPPPVVMTIIGFIMLAMTYLFPIFHWNLPYHPFLAIVFALIGLLISAIGIVHFKSAQTTIDPRKPTETAVLVTTGIYKLSRNPMYLGTLLLLIGWSFYLGNVLAFIFAFVFIPYMNRYQIRPEEQLLSKKFGSTFTTYQQAVRRWL